MKYIHHFIHSAGALLLATALVSIFGNLAGRGYLHPHDPLLGWPIPLLFWIFGAGSFMIASICLWNWKLKLKLYSILWFAINLLVYQAAALWYGHGLSAYLQDAGIATGLSSIWINGLLQITIGYLLLGSTSSLLWLRHCRVIYAGGARNPLTKMTCPSCGGHIQFSTQNLGQITLCPHCKIIIVLSRLESLRMSCFFCRGHIEFPSNAIGRKMPCPHCNKNITLKI